ncbi:Serine/threonine-protein kinase PLK1 [Trichinella pseudospiralis]|uniref:Serine/threonine-protein kinase PLK n=1 Tax=Trichinella pseudospiralis TaxID=6337 RepID=A0A0V0XR31_TRIPS|nr:Serine/threonine-protein kinase PLK1 [Trichinella pseudospiralis]
MAERPKKEEQKELPDIIVNPKQGTRYCKGKFLGKGGFARCYELTESSTNRTYAGKVVSKTLLVKKHQKDKMAQEIQIHSQLSHKHVVQFHSFFEDDQNVYILLELCRRRSLMELHKRRRTITEPEARYFLHQIVDATIYLHENRIIHRDLKLGNLFINDDMMVKLGDFGLATKLDYDGERKKTLCGTPNYIAPEMLSKKGHSYEVDLWAIGCILYTLLVGNPPFETSSLKDTYSRIQRNDYHLPSRLSPAARHMILRLLQSDPKNRPTIKETLNFEFMTSGFCPLRLPTSCLTMAPKFPVEALRAPLQLDRKPLAAFNSVKQEIAVDTHLGTLFRLLTELTRNPNRNTLPCMDEAEDPALAPVFWISKWVDYSDKYGIGYQLSDNSVGVMFNDKTKLVLHADESQLQFIQYNDEEVYCTTENFPEFLKKKVTLMKYFKSYMHEHLLKAGAHKAPSAGDELARLPSLRDWFRTRSCIVFLLNNGTVQVNFFHDHTKLVLCPLMEAVTYMDEKRNFNTYLISALIKSGCSEDLLSRLKYARSMVERLILHQASGSSKKTGSSTGPQSAAGLNPATEQEQDGQELAKTVKN